MKEKKQHTNWYTGATLYLTSAVLIWLISYLLSAIIMGTLHAGVLEELIRTFGNPIAISLTAVYLATILSEVLSIPFGVEYGVKYIRKTQILKDENKILKATIIWFILFALLGFVLQVVTDKMALGLTYSIISLLIRAFVFYFYTKKYLLKSSSCSQTEKTSMA